MSVRLDGDVIRLEGDCHVEDAEALLRLVQEGAGPASLAGCTHLHGALLQVLLAFRTRITEWPNDAFLRDHVAPGLGRAMTSEDRS